MRLKQVIHLYKIWFSASHVPSYSQYTQTVGREWVLAHYISTFVVICPFEYWLSANALKAFMLSIYAANCVEKISAETYAFIRGIFCYGNVSRAWILFFEDEVLLGFIFMFYAFLIGQILMLLNNHVSINCGFFFFSLLLLF